jgi:hypothetical protein
MSIPLPQDKSWKPLDNGYNRNSYEQICIEFKVDKNTDWRQKKSFNDGLGLMYNYYTHDNYYPLPDLQYNSSKYSFTKTTTNEVLHIDYIAQGKEVEDIWSTFILDNSEGFTKAGVERINDSIRTNCWAILGSQSQTRTDIIGTGTAFDAQKQFIANVEDAIQSPVDLPSQITRYQNVLKYARSKVDFVFGTGLYMSPGDMELRIGTIQGYNNEIVIADSTRTLGLNSSVNTKPTPPPTIVTSGTPTIKCGLPELTIVKPAITKHTRDLSAILFNANRNLTPNPKPVQTSPPLDVKEAVEHNNNKTAIIVGGASIGLLGILLYKLFSRNKK